MRIVAWCNKAVEDAGGGGVFGQEVSPLLKRPM